MPRSGGLSSRAVGALLLLCGGALLLAGCDTGSKRASLYQRLTGTWTIERLQEIGGGFDYTSRIDQRYAWVRFGFRESDDGRSYRMRGRLARRDTTILLAEGPVLLRRDQLLRMMGGFRTPSGQIRSITWRYQFEASRALFRLPSGQRNGSRAFLSTLLPEASWGGSQGLELQLAPVDE